MAKKMAKKKIICPDCKEEGIAVPEDIEVGEILECDHCAAEVEVISEDPFEIELIVEEK